MNQTGFKSAGDIAASGSGSTYLRGFIDANYKVNFTRSQVKEFLKSAISLACYRDGSSGGCIRLLDITKDSVTREFHPYSQFAIK